jgi:hypothetical protein
MLRASVSLVLALAATACASGSSFDGRVFRDGAVAFEVREIPPSYRRIQLEGASLAFRDEPNDASIVVKARCGVASDDAPLEALTNHLLIGTTDREFLKEETIPFDGREARYTVVRAKLDGVPRTYGIYVLKKDGCIYDFVRVAPPDRFEPGTDEFKRFVSSFHALGTGLKSDS